MLFRSLLPRPKHVTEEEDPRAELVRRLLEYERMKLAGQALDALPQRGRDFAAIGVWIEETMVERLPGVNVQDLENAWRHLLSLARVRQHHKVTREELSVREHMTGILRSLSQGGFREFSELFEPWRGISVLVVTFLALLELARERLVEVSQTEPYAPIYVKLADYAESE